MPKILFVLPVPTQPRFSKRIKMFSEKGYNITVASFERDYFNKNELPTGIKYYSLGKIQHQNYLKRIPKMILSLRILIPLIKRNTTIYFFSPEMLILLSRFLSKKELLFEIGDIREIKAGNPLAKLFNIYYQKALSQSQSIIVTSEGFRSYISEKFNLNKEKIKVVENKLLLEDFPVESQKKFQTITHFTLGIVGLFRYKNILNFLEAYTQKPRRFKIILYGGGPILDDIYKYVDNDMIHYRGQFKYPDDLSQIYEELDLSFTMYNSDDLNVRLALPNKLYESIYFRKPILVSKNTFLEQKVLDYRVGFSWNQNDMDGLVSYLESPEFLSDYNNLNANFQQINIKEYISQ